MNERNVDLWLGDIADAIHYILDFTKAIDYEKFSTDLQLQHAVLHNFTIIGEAVSKIPQEYKDQYPDVPWREIKGFRNYVVHEYFALDDGIVWNIIHNDLWELSETIAQLLDSK